MNKNDLRFQKTESSIKNAYIHLKSLYSRAIKVKELCEKAMINKTTFYGHYETIDDLKKKVCLEYVADIIESCPQINEEPINIRSVVYSTHNLILKKEKVIRKLYENDIDAFVNDVEKIILDTYIDKDSTEEREIAVRFFIGGAFRLLMFNKNEDQINKTIELMEKFVSTL